MRWLAPKSGVGMVWRFLVAAIVVIGAAAATTAVAGLLEVNTLVGDINIAGGGVKLKRLKLPAPGKPQTILLIGSDHRHGASTKEANTDTMLLMRLNAASSTINVISIPRDLKVDLPGVAAPKINAAYSTGGYDGLIKTIQSQVFPKLRINHFIDTNFTGFSDIIDAIGCVYSDVDHRYYNDTALTGYSSIDVQPGYQRLCGANQSPAGALPFVRFRHTDSDLVRNARQQDFLRWAKDGFSTSALVAKRGTLFKILGRHSTFDKDLGSGDGLLGLFKLVLNANGSTIKQIPFPATDLTSGGVDYVASTPGQEAAAFKQFMTPTRKAPTTKRSPARRDTGRGAPGRRSAGIDTAGLSTDAPDGRSQAAALTHARMPVFYPRLIKAGTSYCSSLAGVCAPGDEPGYQYAHSYPRQYLIPTHGSGHKVPAYRMTLVINAIEGKFYGVQGVAWRTPPLLKSPSGTRVVHGRKLFLYAGDGGQLTTVAWHRGRDTYWVSNDLTSDIPNPQLIGIAASMVRYRP